MDTCLHFTVCRETVFTEEVSMGTWPSSKSKEELRLKFKNLPKDEQNYTDMEYIRLVILLNSWLVSRPGYEGSHLVSCVVPLLLTASLV